MNFEALVAIVVHVAVLITAQVTGQMHPIQMLLENISIKEVFLAEIAPRMGQDLGTAITRWVTVLDMRAQFLHVIDALLSDEYRATFDADETESFLMRGFHVAPQAFLVREILLMGAIRDKAGKRAELHALDFGCAIGVVD
mmetsp:Transcript_4009/g.5317  ORF Transcript_4009/g.5317 Transcript_4009/m.5317 type:complete len:141 (+) Transcript_4009:1685-2107(+)